MQPPNAARTPVLQSPRQFASALGDVVAAQWRCADALLRTLNAEREALSNGDLAAIEDAAAAKTTALAELEELQAREVGLVADLPFGDSGTPLEQVLQQALQWCDEDGVLRARREEVVQLMLDCDSRNRRNGLLVQQRLNYVRRAIDVLHRAHAESLTYGPDGSTGSARSSRLLAEG